MEAKQEKKLSYEELSKNFGNLYEDYQKLMREYRGAIEALNNIDYNNFFLQSAFRVMEHPEMYSPDFVTLISGRIEYVMTKFVSAMNMDEKPEQEESREA
jgi:hypothetical protein